MDEQTPRTGESQPFNTGSEGTFTRPENTGTPAPQTPQPLTIKKKSGAKKWFLWGAVLLLLACAGAFGYWQWAETENLKTELGSVTSERDILKSAQASKADDEVKTGDTKTLTDSDLVRAETEAYLAAAKDNKYVIQASSVKVSGDFAVVTALIPNSDASSKTVVLEKSKSSWVIVYAGTGTMTATDKTKLIDEFGVPASLLQ